MKGALKSFETIKREGKLLIAPDDVRRYRDFVDALVEGQVQEMTLGDPEDSYTYRQLKYIHVEPVKKLCAAQGYTPAQAKLVLLGEHFGWMQLPSGQHIPVKASLSDLTKAEMTALIDWCPVFGAENDLDIHPPEPDQRKRSHAAMRGAP